MIYNGLKFILEDNSILGIIFTNAGKAFHFQGPDTKILGFTLTIVGASLETALNYYHGIEFNSDINLLKLDELPGATNEFYSDLTP